MNHQRINLCSPEYAISHNLRHTLASWISQYEEDFTHAVTLTFNHTQIRRQIMKQDSTKTLNDERMKEIYRSSMRAFKWRLAIRLYGNAWKR